MLQGVPADELPPGLEALHTVDEALMSRQRLLRRSQVSFVVCFLRRKHIGKHGGKIPWMKDDK